MAFTCILKTRNGFGRAVQYPVAAPFLWVTTAGALTVFEHYTLADPNVNRLRFRRTHIDEYGFAHYEELPE